MSITMEIKQSLPHYRRRAGSTNDFGYAMARLVRSACRGSPLLAIIWYAFRFATISRSVADERTLQLLFTERMRWVGKSELVPGYTGYDQGKSGKFVVAEGRDGESKRESREESIIRVR
jgi:hypothetical protein